LPALLIDVDLKLTEFQPRLAQALLKLILSREQECSKVASIGGELCMHRLVRHGDPHTEWTGFMRRQFQMDNLSLSGYRGHGRRMILPKKRMRHLEMIRRRRRNGCVPCLWRQLCLLCRRELTAEGLGLVASRHRFWTPTFPGLKEGPFSCSLCISPG